MIRLEILKEEDRLTVGAILLKNGYTVWVGKETNARTKRSKSYLCAEKRDGETDSYENGVKIVKEKHDKREKDKQNAAILSNEKKNDEFDDAMSKLKGFTSEGQTRLEV